MPARVHQQETPSHRPTRRPVRLAWAAFQRWGSRVGCEVMQQSIEFVKCRCARVVYATAGGRFEEG